jgi:hypothetical protein
MPSALRLTGLVALLVVCPLLGRAAPAPAAKPPAEEKERFSWSDLLPISLQKNPRLSLTVITEMTKAGEAVPPPTPARPAYYLITDGKMVEEGDVIAGEKPPKRELLLRALKSALAVNGYLPASPEHPPTLAIHYMWGSFNRLSGLETTLPGASAEEPDTTVEDDGSNLLTSDPAVRKNQLLRASVIGGGKFARELAEATRGGATGLMVFRGRDARTEWLVDEVAHSNRYFIIATAFDVGAAQRREKVVLWITKISTDSTGLSMDESMLALVGNAGPHFGRAMTEAATLRVRLKEGKVEIGTPTVQEYLERAPERTTPPVKK